MRHTMASVELLTLFLMIVSWKIEGNLVLVKLLQTGNNTTRYHSQGIVIRSVVSKCKYTSYSIGFCSAHDAFDYLIDQKESRFIKYIEIQNKQGLQEHWRTGCTFVNITIQKKNHLKEGENAIRASVIQFLLSVITDFTWTGWEFDREQQLLRKKD